MSKDTLVTRVSLLLAGWTILAGIGIPLVGILNSGMARSIGNRVGGERLGRADILDAMPFPQPAGAAKGREPTFRRQAGAGQHDDRAWLNHGDRYRSAPAPSRPGSA